MAATKKLCIFIVLILGKANYLKPCSGRVLIVIDRSHGQILLCQG